MATGIGRKDATSTFLVALATLSILLSSPATAQISIGTPKFGSFDGGQFDTVNLGNLNVHFAIPIVHKAGRGVPLAYDLTYDSSVWSPVTSGSTTSWQPATKWGWSTPWVGAAGYIATQETGGQCTTLVDVNGQWVYEVTGGWQNYTNWQYIDNNGVAHSFPGVQWSFSGGSCGTVNDNTYPATQASDSSGLILYAGSCSSPGPQGNSLCVQAPNGTQVFPVMNPGSTPLAYKVGPDANGNQITSTTGQNLLQITDTLGQLALTVSGISPITYQYTGPGGTSPTYKLYYTAYNVKTAFNCGTTQEYTATGVSLVSSIVLPDGSQYSISYEPTPGHSGYYTGRIQSITLPTGGTVQYTYTGSNDGINCSDGTTVGLQRSLTPGGTWQYARTGSGTAWTTTQTDPGNNQIAINFEETSNNNFYETQRLTYQGSTSGTLLRTDITCFNGQNVGSPSSCYNTGIAPQITRITHFTYIPDPSGLQSETDTTYNTLGLLLHVNEYDYGNGAVGSLIRQTITQYAGGMSNGIVDRPSSVTIEDVNNAVKAYTAYSYDESPPTTPGGTTPNWVSVSGSRGNLTTVQVQANGSTNLYRHYTYYNTGTLATSTDVSTSSTINGATTTYNYNNTGSPSPSCGNAFVTSISEPVGSMSRSFTWDCSGGVLTSVTDENGYTSSTAYSGTNYTNYFWRPYSTTDEAGTTTDNFYYLNTAIPPIEFQTESKYHTPFNNGTSTVDKVTTTDGFGKPVFSQTRQGPNASNYDTVATCYDGFGRVSFSSLPYSATLATSSSTCPYPSNSNGTTTTYDAMARTYQMTAGDGGQTTFSYSKNDTLVTRTSPQ